jgi:8-amino-7-oxononanoate synthase
LWDNADRLYQGLKALGAKVGPTASPVVAVEMEDRSYVNLVIPPASPSTNFLLRNSVSAAHSTEQIDRIES